MKLVRYGPKGAERPGMLDDTGSVLDLSGHIDDVGAKALLPEQLERLRALDRARLPRVANSPRLGPCVAGVGKIVCVGLNYRDHAAESNMPVPDEPVLFLKPPSAITGPNDDVEIPPGSEKTDWEVELGVVIGRPGKYIALDNAMEHVAGYCVVNDVSERAYQLERGGQWDKGKGCDTFAPIGPWLVTRDEIADPQNLDLWLEVDGQRTQTGNTRTMIFSIHHLVSYISHFMSLQSGDLISTGTPPGVGLGHKPPRFLRVGQTMRLGISGLGVQSQTTTAAVKVYR
jgi:2-keto-4-pentenoate hydratase/2-oxohepta-3-ene-1,7-dioic acid hydratase in catechol pathway